MSGQDVHAGGLVLTMPDGWGRLDAPAGTVAYGPPVPADPAFRPSIVVTAAPSSGPIDVVSSETIAAVLAIQPRAQVFWVAPSDPGSPPARTIEYGYDTERTWVTVRQWVTIAGQQQVHVTASAGVEDFEDLEAPFRAVVDSVRAVPAVDVRADGGAAGAGAGRFGAGDVGAGDVGAGGVGAGRVGTPRSDELVSGMLGARTEALDGVAATAPRPVGRWLLTRADLEHLWSLRGRGIVSAATRRSESGRSLHEQGLTNALGALTPDGERIALHLAEPEDRIGAVARHGGEETVCGLWLHGSTALVRFGRPVADLATGGPGEAGERYDVLPVGRAFGQLVAWTGLSPAWALAASAELAVTETALADRVAGASPTDACPVDDPVLRRFWDAPRWTRLRVWNERTGRGSDVVLAAGAGAFRPVPTESGVRRVEPVPTGTVFRDLVSTLDAVVEPVG